MEATVIKRAAMNESLWEVERLRLMGRDEVFMICPGFRILIAASQLEEFSCQQEIPDRISGYG